MRERGEGKTNSIENFVSFSSGEREGKERKSFLSLAFFLSVNILD